MIFPFNLKMICAYKVIEYLIIIAFIILLAVSCILLSQMYVCDENSCKAFKSAANKAPVNTKDYVIDILQSQTVDGRWCFAFIGAAIIMPLTMYLTCVPFTVYYCTISFIISFIVIYSLYAFFTHHYLYYLNRYTIEFIEDACTGVRNPRENDRGLPNENDDDVTVCNNDLCVTFATPINIF